MSVKRPENVTEIVPPCGEVLASQFAAFLGDDFNVSTLVDDLKSRSMFREGRSFVGGLANDVGVRTAQRTILDRTYVTAACEADRTKNSEIADYRLFINNDGEYEETAHIEISPNATRALYRPVHEIISSFGDQDILTPQKVRARAVEIAFRAIYTNVLTQMLVKRHALEVIDGDVSVEEEAVAKINGLHDKVFGADKTRDPAVRLDRLAMAVGGTAMMKHVFSRLSSTPDIGIHQTIANIPMKFYCVAKREAKPLHQHGVSFPLAYALNSKDAAFFMKNWFGNGEQPVPSRPQLRLV